MKDPIQFLFWLQGYLAAIECEMTELSRDHRQMIEGALRLAIDNYLKGKE